jgi:hypothetical protein
MLAEKVLAGKSKIEDYFPEYANYTVPEDGKISKRASPLRNTTVFSVIQTHLMSLRNSTNLNQSSLPLPHP